MKPISERKYKSIARFIKWTFIISTVLSMYYSAKGIDQASNVLIRLQHTIFRISMIWVILFSVSFPFLLKLKIRTTDGEKRPNRNEMGMPLIFLVLLNLILA